MTEENIFPAYIPRDEEREILDAVNLLGQDRQSRAVLLYGRGGVGKTQLVRALAERHSADGMIAWLDPIDVDDTEYWLLSNLEETVARRLDPEDRHFGPYRAYLTQLPSYTRTQASPETVVSHLGRIKQVFTECYKNFIAESHRTVVLTFDTVEAIRGMHLLPTLSQWMKMLPSTLFILSGRPIPADSEGEDLIQRELEDPYQGIPFTIVQLGEFTRQAASEYLEKSHITAGLGAKERMKLVLLTRGHPLWLALTVSYLNTKGLPEEVEMSLKDIEWNMPYDREMTEKGGQLGESFRHRLVAPYRETDFWSEAVKRLAVVRQGVNEPIWRQLMVDRPFPPEVTSWGEAWDRLLEIPWIRQRANRRFVTLHDAMAEQLAQRVIPVNDQDGGWRRNLWQRVIDIYGAQAEGKEAELAEQRAALDRRFAPHDRLPRRIEQYDESSLGRAFVEEAAKLEAGKRELDQLKTVRLVYQGLTNFAVGCAEFLRLLEAAKDERDVLFQELLAMAVERFLPESVDTRVFDNLISGVINEFRHWLTSEQPGVYLEISLSLADYMITTEQPDRAVRLLERLPTADASVDQLYRLNNLLGNAYLRLPGQVREALPRLRRALALAEGTELASADRHRLIAKAHKELGFYYRNVGLWQEADRAYGQARDAISIALTTRGSDDDRAEMSSIYNNWAYVKGLGGSYRDGSNLIESAITVRKRLKMRLEEGISQSVRGEVYRYQQRFQRAWEAYSTAEYIFDEQRSMPWLGMVYQEQAICLFQAAEDGVDLERGSDAMARARDLVSRSVTICRDQHVRGYPSALNRAGRIYGKEDPDVGLRYLAEGIEQAHALSDGWFWFANLVEYAELSYRAWIETARSDYRDGIDRQAPIIDQAMTEYIDEAIYEYQYPDLRGRWDIVCGHLAIRDWLATRDDGLLGSALRAYIQGFGLIAQGGHVGSSGTSVIPGEFETFGKLVAQLPPDIQASWREALRHAWRELEEGSTQLLARLEELY